MTPTGSNADDRYRWVLHRLWIAAGNEALAYTQATGHSVRADRTWANLYDLRNHLAGLSQQRLCLTSGGSGVSGYAAISVAWHGRPGVT